MKGVLDLIKIERPSGPSVLLVEDDVVLGRLMTTLLNEAGYRSLTIADHDEIEAAIDRFHPSCVILDGELGRTGHERSWGDAAAIGRAHPGLPVVMFTANEDAVAEERAGTSRRSREARFVGVVPKPFVVDDFLATLKRAVDGVPLTSGDPVAISADPSGPAASERTKVDLFSAAAHELKTPLATISGQMQLARKVMAKDPARGRAAVDIALRQVERMNRLIADLQNLVRPKATALSSEIVTFDLCEAVGDAIKRHEHEEATRIRLDRPKEGILVRGHPDRIAEILDNLLSNASRYSNSGAPIDVAVTTIAGEAHVRVEDYGIGVAAEDRDRMFLAHVRTSRTRHVPGSGLALHISRRPAEQNGGRLWLDDSTDAGSVFAFTLPLAD